MKEAIGIGIIILLGVLAYFGVKKAKEKNQKSKLAISELIDPYFGNIKSGEYEKAYDLTDNRYQQVWPYEQFVKTYNERFKEHGKLISWESYRLKNESNLFSEETLLQIYLHLVYEDYKFDVMIEVAENAIDQKIIMSWEEMASGRLDKTLF